MPQLNLKTMPFEYSTEYYSKLSKNLTYLICLVVIVIEYFVVCIFLMVVSSNDFILSLFLIILNFMYFKLK